MRDVLARDEPVEAMRVEVLIGLPNGSARALVRSRQGGTPAWVVRVGDFIGKPRRVAAPGGIELLANARVERIHCLGVDLAFDAGDDRPFSYPKVQLLLQ